MTSIRMTVDAEIDLEELFEQVSDEYLIAEVEDRELDVANQPRELELIYEEFRRRGDAPQILKDYLYKCIGKIL